MSNFVSDQIIDGIIMDVSDMPAQHVIWELGDNAGSAPFDMDALRDKLIQQRFEAVPDGVPAC